MGIARHRPSSKKVSRFLRLLYIDQDNSGSLMKTFAFSSHDSSLKASRPPKYASLGIRGCFGSYRYISKICAWLVKKFLSEVDGWEILQIRRVGKHIPWFMNFYLSQLLSRMSSYRGWWNRIKLTRPVRQSQRGFGSRRIFATSGWGNIES